MPRPGDSGWNRKVSMTMSKLIAALDGAVEAPKPRAVIPQPDKDVRATIQAAVAEDEKCYSCEASLFKAPFFYNGPAPDNDSGRGWICGECHDKLITDKPWAASEFRWDRFPSATKMVVFPRNMEVKDYPQIY